MKFDNKNALKLQIATYLEESFAMVGNMMLQDLFDHIEANNEKEAQEYVEAHYDNNIFELIVPYLEKAKEEYDKYRKTPDGIEALAELKKIMEETKQAAIKLEQSRKIVKTDNSGDGNVH